IHVAAEQCVTDTMPEANLLQVLERLDEIGEHDRFARVRRKHLSQPQPFAAIGDSGSRLVNLLQELPVYAFGYGPVLRPRAAYRPPERVRAASGMPLHPLERQRRRAARFVIPLHE